MVQGRGVPGARLRRGGGDASRRRGRGFARRRPLDARHMPVARGGPLLGRNSIVRRRGPIAVVATGHRRDVRGGQTSLRDGGVRRLRRPRRRPQRDDDLEQPRRHGRSRTHRPRERADVSAPASAATLAPQIG